MIAFSRNPDILTSTAELLVCPVNCVGVMGKGLALAFKEALGPQYFDDYKASCVNRQLRPGKVLISKAVNLTVANFATKDHWRDPSKMEWIVTGLQELHILCVVYGFGSVAIPPLGAGLGGLEPKAVLKAVREEFDNSSVLAVLYRFGTET